ncbi:hypothetical protein BLOT_001506 [Blomia tropicalis]|nr:hypothetical protein BLOT_001506 [Blomia tropicalis]
MATYQLFSTNVNIVGTSLFHNLLHIFIYHDQMKQIMVYHIPLVNIVPLMGKIFINHNVRKSSLKEFIGYDPILLEKKIPKSVFHLELPKFVDDQITLCFIFPNTDLNEQQVICSNGKPEKTIHVNGTLSTIIWGSQHRGQHWTRNEQTKSKWNIRDVSYYHGQLWYGNFLYHEMFECRTESIPKLTDSVLSPKEMGGENRKLYLLYGIFILHFLAAFFMITTY